MEPGVLRSSRARDDSGFTLVEAIVALGVLATIMTALAYAMIGSLTASRASRVEQQAIDFATQRLEQIRQLDFGTIGHDSADVASDSEWVSSCGSSVPCVDPGTGAEEPLVLGGQVSPHLQTVEATVANNTTFTLRTFVTSPGDQYDATYKRVTVVASWMAGSIPRQRSISSFVASTTRGLPLPLFKLTPVGSTSAVLNPGDNILYRFELTNQGAPDKWNLTVSDPTGWALYADDGDGDWELGIDPQVVDTSADGIQDTGLVDPTATYTFWAYRAGASNTQIGAVNARFTAVSVMQPQAASGTAYVDTVATIVEGVVTQTPTPTPAPSGLAAPTALSASVSGTTVTLTWGAVDSANRYEVYRNGVLQGSTSSTTWTGLWPAGTYSVQVQAIKGTEVSALSASVSVQVAVAPLTTSTVEVGLPMVMAVDGPTMTLSPVPVSADCPALNDLLPGSGTGTIREFALHNGTPTSAVTVSAMPWYSVDIADVGGRVVRRGGAFGETDPKKVVDWRANVDKRTYSGNAILRLWVAPLPNEGLDEVTLKAQLFKWKSPPGVREAIAGSGAALPPMTSYTCAGGWQEFQWSLPLTSPASMKKNEYIGVRIWNEGDQDLRIAYDIKDLYPSSLTLREE